MSYYLVNGLMNLLLVLFLILLCAAEYALCAVIYPELGKEFGLLPWLLKAGIPAALLLCVWGSWMLIRKQQVTA